MDKSGTGFWLLANLGMQNAGVAHGHCGRCAPPTWDCEMHEMMKGLSRSASTVGRANSGQTGPAKVC